MQVKIESAPTVVEYWLTRQFIHVLAEVAPAFEEYLPALQSTQSSEPVPVLYLPTAHGTQPAEPPGPW